MDFKIESPNVALIVKYKPFASSSATIPIVRIGVGEELTIADAKVSAHTYYTSLASALSDFDTDHPDFKYHNPFKTALTESDVTIGTISGNEVEASVGDAVTLNCQVSHASYTVSFEWFKEGEVIPGATSNNISTASLLEEHYGEYECRVTVTDNVDVRQLVFSRLFSVVAPVPAFTSATAIGA